MLQFGKWACLVFLFEEVLVLVFRKSDLQQGSLVEEVFLTD